MDKNKRRATQARYRERHREELRAKNRIYAATHRQEQKAYNAAHKDQVNETKARYRERHGEELRAKNKAYCAAHREEIKAYCAAHREEKKDYDKVYRAAHQEERKAWQGAYYAAHREEKRAYNKARYSELASKAIEQAHVTALESGTAPSPDAVPYGVVYEVHNVVTNRYYVGQTRKGVEVRYSHGFLNTRHHSTNALMQQDREQYGDESFTEPAVIFVVYGNQYDLDKAEAHYIDEFNAFTEGYNRRRGNIFTDRGVD